jgi:hypothetical protein
LLVYFRYSFTIIITNFLAVIHDNHHFCLETLKSEHGSSPRFQDYECQAKDFDQHGRVALKQLSTPNFQNGVGVVFFSQNEAEGKQRYEGQIKNSLPGNIF